ncbi:unnamed protein product [Aureobasidium uvarum]|uniref:Uncharacterized protein n=1 Tax=Aureobasidium uvarum TaxID=2773716 RepID=A0A9N8KIB4_9PEZI|nr:unnamed protein product [Aureobasidium uvarum]
MAQTSTSQPNLWKPRYAAKQHQEKPQPAQQFTRSRSLREPFDAAELTRKLENYRQELKLEKARRELANKKLAEKAEKTDKADKPLSSAQPPPAERDVSSTVPELKSGAGVKRAQSVSALKNLSVNEQPERRRSIIHRSRKQSAQEDAPIEPTKPFVPRVAARQFANTTTPMKEKSETAKTSSHQAPEPKPKDIKVKDTSNKHILDWSEPAIHTKPASPPLPPTSEFPDAERAQARMHALHAFRDASKAGRPRPLSTALENMREWDAVDNVYSKHAIPVHEEPEATSTYVPPAYRPALKAADRHDWAQGSQCGDSARQSLHLFRKKDSAHEEAEMAGLKASMRPSPKPRQKSHGDASDRLVGDAVKQIREERRRSSILNMFRRH